MQCFGLLNVQSIESRAVIEKYPESNILETSHNIPLKAQENPYSSHFYVFHQSRIHVLPVNSASCIPGCTEALSWYPPP